MLLSVTQAQPPPLPHPARMLAHPQAQAFRSTSPSLDPQDAGRREQLLAGPSWLPPWPAHGHYNHPVAIHSERP